MNAERRPKGAAQRQARRPETNVTAEETPLNSEPGTRLLELARRFTTQGRRVFPIQIVRNDDGSTTKKPSIKGYHGTAPFTVTELARMPWNRADYVGMALFPGEVALDVDVKGGAPGFEQLAQFEAEYGRLPATVSQSTASGGEHLLFRTHMPDRVVGRLETAQGEAAHIDVVHRGNRYLVIYEPEKLLDHWDELAAFPSTWLPLITKQPKQSKQRNNRPAGKQTQRRSSTPPAARGGSLDGLVAAVASARNFRNDTLNSNVFVAVLSGECTPADLDRFRDAARTVGLDDDEIDSTVESATSAARAQWRDPAAWYRWVTTEIDALGVRNGHALKDAAAHFAASRVRLGKELIGMPIRRLAESIGVTKKTAHALLRRMVAQGWLYRRNSAEGKGLRYGLSTPPAGSRGDSLPVVVFPTGGLSPFAPTDLHRMRLRVHPAFHRFGGGLLLPPSTLSVTAELMAGTDRIADLVTATGLSRGTVRRALGILESVGVVLRVADGLVTVDRDVEVTLMRWAVRMGVADRAAQQAAQHERERMAWSGRRAQLKDAAWRVLDARRAAAGTDAA